MEDKSFLTAIILCLGVYIFWFSFVEPKLPKQPALPTAQNAVTGAPASNELNSKDSVRPEKNPPPPITIHLANAEVQLSPLGGSISSYRYRGPLGLVELIADPQASSGFLSSGSMLFSLSPQADSTQGPRFEAKLPSGLVLRKEFYFGKGNDLNRLLITLANPTRSRLQLASFNLELGPGLGTVESEQKDNAKLWRAIGLFPPSPDRTQDKLEALKNGEREGPWRWLAIDNRYFLAAALASPENFGRFQVEASHANGHVAPFMRIFAKPVSLSPGESKSIEIPFYLGPKSYLALENLHRGLELSVNFGWFDTLGRWMLKLLQFLHRMTGNYGWSIILLTLMIQTALFPLTFKSLKSMSKMRTLQPEIAKLQQKFKNDPSRLNTEMMELYKAKGANPMGGCLPMLAQMPIFVALFNALRNAWELHGAPWVFWVHDLSAHDPFYILPIVMGGIMFFQNRLNPAATADPNQAAMMKWMPVVFTFMFIKFPAGLVLYWLTNSLLSTIQQATLRKQLAS